MNIDAQWPSPELAKVKVLEIQAKLHRWAKEAPEMVFKDLYNLISEPAFLVNAWNRVKRNKGSRSAGVDGQTVLDIEIGRGELALLTDIRQQLKTRDFRPLPVRERMIPKPESTKRRRLGIPTIRDRIVQASLKSVLEPIFEIDFHPCSYGFRPNRRAQDAIAEIHFFATRGYEWVLEGDIKACFDEIDHTALLSRVSRRIGDRKVLGLIKAFCKSGILSEAKILKGDKSGTPQGGILSPLLSNIALSVLDEVFTRKWAEFGVNPGQRQYRRKKGLPTYRLVRYADDFVILVSGNKKHTEDLLTVCQQTLDPVGLKLSDEKTLITHIDKGLNFLGFRIQRRKKPSCQKTMIYTWPSKDALARVKSKVRTASRIDRNVSLTTLLGFVNPILRGWNNYFRHGVSKRSFSYLRAFTWRRVICWLRHKHPKRSWKELRRMYLPSWWPTEGKEQLFNTGEVAVTRYRYRGQKIPSPWEEHAA